MMQQHYASGQIQKDTNFHEELTCQYLKSPKFMKKLKLSITYHCFGENMTRHHKRNIYEKVSTMMKKFIRE